MDQNQNHPLEEELRSSRIYKTLRGAGDPVTEKIAAGLDVAVESLDHALNSVAPTVKRGVTTAQRAAATWQQTAGQQPTPGPRAGNRQTAARQRRAQWNTAQTAPGPQQPQQPQQPAAGAHAKRPAGVNPAPAPQMPPMKLVRRGSPAKFYLTGVAALIYAMNFPLYEASHFIAFALALVMVFLLSSKIFKGKKEFVPIEPEKPKEPPKPKEEEKPKPSRTGNPEVDKIIDEGNDYLRKLRAANDAIPDQSMSEDISRMEKASADIFRFIEAHPEKASQIRKFMNYYLPTTLKLLNSYQRLSTQSAKGENITSTMFNIAGMMHTVADAFEKQLDSLFTDEAMDVSADISVFETLLKQEGFVEEKNAPQKKE